MKTTERHHLKDNELAIALNQAQQWAGSNSKTLTTTVVAIVLVAGAVLGFLAYRNNNDNKARVLLAEAMVIEEARVMPPAPPSGTTNDPNAIGGFKPYTPELQASDAAKLTASIQPLHESLSAVAQKVV